MPECHALRRAHRTPRRRTWPLVVAVLLGTSLALAAAVNAQDTRAMIEPFFRLPSGIRLVEVTPEAFGSRAAEVRKVRAFTFPDADRTTIYVNIDDPLWKHAAIGAGHEFYRAVLASVVAHEFWHLGHGPSESGALQEELRVWQTFIRDRLVPTAEGLQHALLVDRDIRTARVTEVQASAAASKYQPPER